MSSNGRFDLVKSVPSRDDLFFPFEQHFNQIFNEFFSDTGLSSVKGKAGYPKLDVITTDGKWIVEVALPGVNAEDVTVEVIPPEETSYGTPEYRPKPALLKISGRMSEAHQYGDHARYHVKELRRSSFERTMTLPDYVHGDPEATMKNGILSLAWALPESKVPERKTIAIKQLDK